MRMYPFSARFFFLYIIQTDQVMNNEANQTAEIILERFYKIYTTLIC